MVVHEFDAGLSSITGWDVDDLQRSEAFSIIRRVEIRLKYLEEWIRLGTPFSFVSGRFNTVMLRGLIYCLL